MAKAPITKTTSPTAGASATAPAAPATTESSTVPSAPAEPQAEGSAEDVGASATTPVAPATTESSTVPPEGESLDLWVHNKGAFSKTEPRSKVLLGAGQTTHIQISSVAMRQTIERNIEQMNHLNGGRLLVLVDQPVAPEPEKDS